MFCALLGLRGTWKVTAGQAMAIKYQSVILQQVPLMDLTNNRYGIALAEAGLSPADAVQAILDAIINGDMTPEPPEYSANHNC